MERHFYAHGKLLLTGEYFVLDGAEALAIPTGYGQHMKVNQGSGPYEISWTALDVQGKAWLNCVFSGANFSILDSNDPASAQRLQSMLLACRKFNPEFLQFHHHYTIETTLEFPREWGLGTSSTLISMMGKWAEVDPWLLLETTFGGSGYDLACAETSYPIIYQLQDGKPLTRPAILNPLLYKHLFFVYLGTKQNSREGIKMYREKGRPAAHVIHEITRITRDFIGAQEIAQLVSAFKNHEKIVGKYLDLMTLQSNLFPDFKGAVKSLGAWGGDFFAAISEEEDNHYLQSYFQEKGYNTIIPYEKMVL